jgi:hypothetical protein
MGRAFIRNGEIEERVYLVGGTQKERDPWDGWIHGSFGGRDGVVWIGFF